MIRLGLWIWEGFRVALVVKNPPANAGDIRDGSVSELGRSPGGGHDNPLQFSCLEDLMDRGAWQATVHSVTQSWTWLKRFSMHAGMDLGNNSTEVNWHCPCIVTSTWLVTDNINLDRFVKVLGARFLHYKIVLFYFVSFHTLQKITGSSPYPRSRELSSTSKSKSV